MADFVIREWTLAPYPGDQAPPHIHHRGDEAFYVLEGELEVLDGSERYRLETGQLHVVEAGHVHTFATVGDREARILVVMTPEIDRLITALHAGPVSDMQAVWAAHHSSLAT
jgi:mannose-6-phosphate isomerase-like protein (cupin superfamily)